MASYVYRSQNKPGQGTERARSIDLGCQLYLAQGRGMPLVEALYEGLPEMVDTGLLLKALLIRFGVLPESGFEADKKTLPPVQVATALKRVFEEVDPKYCGEGGSASQDREQGCLSRDPKHIDPYRRIVDFMNWQLQQVLADKSVKEELRWRGLIIGPEQAIMIAMTLFALLTMAQRGVWRRLVEGLVKRDNRYRSGGLDETGVTDLKDWEIGVLELWRSPFRGRILKNLLYLNPNDSDIGQDASYRALGGIDWRADSKDIQKTRDVQWRKIASFIGLMKGQGENPELVIEHALSRQTGVLKEEIHNSRWTVRWISKALPAVGFIGTVRGIMEALGGADVIRACGSTCRTGIGGHRSE